MAEQTYNSCVKMNKPIRFFGLSSLQAIILFICILVSVLGMLMSGVNFLVMLLVFSCEIYGLSLVLKKLIIANKKGTPDFLGAYTTLKYTPKKITDSNFLFSFLINNKVEENGN